MKYEFARKKSMKSSFNNTFKAFLNQYWQMLFLPVLLGMNYFLRHNLENADNLIYDVLLQRLPNIDTFPLWKLLLPLQEHYGSWMSSSLVLLHFIQRVITPAQSYYLVNALLILASFLFSYIAFRSYIFSYTLAICLGFGTQYYHLYNIPTVVSFYLYTIYILALFLSSYKFIIAEKGKWFWFASFLVSLFLTSIAYEGWLDVFVFMMLASVYGIILFRNTKQPNRLKRLGLISVITLLVACIYMLIKVQYGYGQSAGSESDIVSNYLPEKSLIFWDMFSNYMTLFYMTVSNFLPSFFIVPWDMIVYGNQGLIALQNGYHAARTKYVPLNMIYDWRYFSGIFLAIFVYFIVKVMRKSLQKDLSNRSNYIALTIFMIIVATTGPTHVIVKFRPMHTLPFLNYQVVVGIIGMSLLISYLLMMLYRQMPKKWISRLVIGSTWLVIFYSVLTRPATISFASDYMGVLSGQMPDPLKALLLLIQH
jgi:hypothetical protein